MRSLSATAFKLRRQEPGQDHSRPIIVARRNGELDQRSALLFGTPQPPQYETNVASADVRASLGSQFTGISPVAWFHLPENFNNLLHPPLSFREARADRLRRRSSAWGCFLSRFLAVPGHPMGPPRYRPDHSSRLVELTSETNVPDSAGPL